MPHARGRIVLLLALAAACSACAPESGSAQGEEVHTLYSFFFWVASGVFAVTAGLLGWSLFRYRDRGRDEDLPPQFETNTKLEIAWFAIPLLIVAVLFVATAQVLWRTDPEPGTEDLTITVTAFQWGWRFEYEDLGVTISGTAQDPPTVVVPTDTSLALQLEAADVVHSFSVPKFLVKRDAIPGRTTRIDVTVEEEGTYRGFCTEFCGLLHEAMTFEFRAVPEDEFDSWLEEEASDGNG